MPLRYNPAQAAVVDQDNRNMATGSQGVLAMSAEIDDIWAAIDTGSIGIQSQAADIDALALGGGEFTYNPSGATGLTFAYNAGRFHNGYQMVAGAAGTLVLPASSTNYIDLDKSGVVRSNTSGFVPGRMPLMIVVTSSTGISSVINSRCLLSFAGPGGVNGTMLSAVAATRSIEKGLGTLTATTEFLVTSPVTGALSLAVFASATAVATSGSNTWSWGIVNKGQLGTGTAQMLDTGADNSTQSAGGSAVTAYAPRELTLSGTGGNLIVNQNDVLAITLTGAGSPTAMNECILRLDFSFTN